LPPSKNEKNQTRSYAKTAAVRWLLGISLALAQIPHALAADTWPLEHTDFTGIQFVDSLHGWILGANTVVSTSDGGQSWQAQSGVTQDSINAFYFLDMQHGWAVNGAMLTTIDGGKRWAEKKKDFIYISGIHFVDAQHGWMVAQRNTLYVTTDGGKVWKTQRVGQGTDADLNGIYFVDAQHGWIVGDNTLLASTDGGQNWRAQTVRTTGNVPRYFRSVNFVDTSNGWVVGAFGRVLATKDGGNHWYEQRPPSAEKVEEYLDSVHFVDATHGWAVGAILEHGKPHGEVIATSDGGVHWVKQSSETLNKLVGVQFIDVNHGWAVGENGTIIRTSDGGEHWNTQKIGESSPYSLTEKPTPDALSGKGDETSRN
jgi:photosystem II stability/assembly factor-like uncharacterized protein